MRKKMLSYLVRAWKNRWFKVTTVILLLQFGGLPQRKPGFYCNDPSLSYPFTGDTITWKMLLTLAALLPLIFMFAVEAFCSRSEVKRQENRSSNIKFVWKLYVEYAYGLVLDLALVQILKVLVGEPRPHFFDVCQPDTPCVGSEFVSSYKCTNPLYSYIKRADAGRSFPSGHTSVAVHAALFIIWYLQRMKETICRHVSTYALILVQSMLVVCALSCGISRVTDRRHHWWDVLAGAILGFSILVYTIMYLCKDVQYFERSMGSVVITNGEFEIPLRKNQSDSMEDTSCDIEERVLENTNT